MCVRITRRQRHNVSLTSAITVPGTPEQHAPTTQEHDQKRQQDKDADLNLYYKVFRRYRPEVGESNAESVARTTALEAEYQYLLMKGRTKPD